MEKVIIPTLHEEGLKKDHLGYKLTKKKVRQMADNPYFINSRCYRSSDEEMTLQQDYIDKKGLLKLMRITENRLWRCDRIVDDLKKYREKEEKEMTIIGLELKEKAEVRELRKEPLNKKLIEELNEIDREVLDHAYEAYVDSKLKIKIKMWEKGKAIDEYFRGVKESPSWRELSRITDRSNQSLKKWWELYKDNPKRNLYEIKAEREAEAWAYKALKDNIFIDPPFTKHRGIGTCSGHKRYPTIKSAYHANLRINKLKSQISELEDRKTRLDDRINELREDIEHFEKIKMQLKINPPS